MYTKIIFTWVSMLTFAFLCSCSTSDNNQMVVGTNAEFPPFTALDSNGKPVGFDIDIAKEVAQRLGKNIQFKDMPFDALISDLVLGNIDFIAAGMSETPERAARVLFTKSYLSGDPLVILSIGKESLLNTIEDLRGKTVVVNEGYTADTLLSGHSEINLLRLSAPADAFLALKNGRAAAYVTAQSTVNNFMKTQKEQQFYSAIIDGTAETCALVISKKNPQLLREIQTALDSMEKDGTLAALKKKWDLQ